MAPGRSLSGSNFFHFLAVFRGNKLNNRLAQPPRGCRLLSEILNPPLVRAQKHAFGGHLYCDYFLTSPPLPVPLDPLQNLIQKKFIS